MISTIRAGQLPQLSKIINELALDSHFDGDLVLEGRDPILASPHKLGEATSFALLLEALAAASAWKLRSGKSLDKLSVNITEAIHSLHSTHFTKQYGYPMSVGAEFIPTNGLFKCKDGRFIMTHSGPPYVKLERGYLNFFDCGNNRESIAREIQKYDSLELQEKLSELGLTGCIAYSPEEWRAHPQGKALLEAPVIEIEKIADGKPLGLKGDAKYPLSDIKALDFTHVLAGPRSMRSLASYGSEVLHISSPYHRDTISQNILVNMGKRSAYLQLTEKADLESMKNLVQETDVFANSYRPQVAEKFSLLPEIISKNHKGIICVSINCYGHSGPWMQRPGFDQNAQVACGFAHKEGEGKGEGHEKPQFSPVFYLNDLLTAYLAAAGTMSALIRRATEGGSYHVKLSLARTNMWVQDLGYISPAEFKGKPEKDEYPVIYRTVSTDLGEISELRAAVETGSLPKLDLRLLRGFGSDRASWS